MQARNEVGWSAFSAELSDAQSVQVQVVPYTPSSPIRDSTTSSTQLVVNWAQISSPQNGGSAITSYNLQFDQGTAGTSWTDLIGNPTDSLALTHTVTGAIEAGRTYYFRLRVKNLQGWSSYSAQAPVIAASVPGAPQSVTTSYSGSKVRITWQAPASTGGSPITSYQIAIKLADGTYQSPLTG